MRKIIGISAGFLLVIMAVWTGCSEADLRGFKFLYEEPEPPVINELTYNVKNCEAPYSVRFKADLQKVLGNEKFLWDFGDGTTDTSRIPDHPYLTNNVFTVKLVVSNPIGSDSSSITIDMTQAFPVTAKFSYTAINDNFRAPAKIIFNNQSQGASIFKWTFGDGKENDGFDTEYEYNTAGAYNVTLVAKCTNQTEDVYSVAIPISDPPSTISFREIHVWLDDRFKGMDLGVELWLNEAYLGKSFARSNVYDYPESWIIPDGWQEGAAILQNLSYASNEVMKLIILDVENNIIVHEFLLTTKFFQDEFYPKSFIIEDSDNAAVEIFVSY